MQHMVLSLCKQVSGRVLLNHDWLDITIIIIIGIQPLGRSRQRPELSQATGMGLVSCILGKFLGV